MAPLRYSRRAVGSRSLGAAGRHVALGGLDVSALSPSTGPGRGSVGRRVRNAGGRGTGFRRGGRRRRPAPGVGRGFARVAVAVDVGPGGLTARDGGAAGTATGLWFGGVGGGGGGGEGVGTGPEGPAASRAVLIGVVRNRRRAAADPVWDRSPGVAVAPVTRRGQQQQDGPGDPAVTRCQGVAAGSKRAPPLGQRAGSSVGPRPVTRPSTPSASSERRPPGAAVRRGVATMSITRPPPSAPAHHGGQPDPYTIRWSTPPDRPPRRTKAGGAIPDSPSRPPRAVRGAPGPARGAARPPGHDGRRGRSRADPVERRSIRSGRAAAAGAPAAREWPAAERGAARASWPEPRAWRCEPVRPNCPRPCGRSLTRRRCSASCLHHGNGTGRAVHRRTGVGRFPVVCRRTASPSSGRAARTRLVGRGRPDAHAVGTGPSVVACRQPEHLAMRPAPRPSGDGGCGAQHGQPSARPDPDSSQSAVANRPPVIGHDLTRHQGVVVHAADPVSSRRLSNA